MRYQNDNNNEDDDDAESLCDRGCAMRGKKNEGESELNR
jgi:hypothetical protein